MSHLQTAAARASRASSKGGVNVVVRRWRELRAGAQTACFLSLLRSVVLDWLATIRVGVPRREGAGGAG